MVQSEDAFLKTLKNIPGPKKLFYVHNELTTRSLIFKSEMMKTLQY